MVIADFFFRLLLWGTVFLGSVIPVLASKIGLGTRQTNEIEGLIAGVSVLLGVLLLFRQRVTDLPRTGLVLIMVLSLIWSLLGGLVGLARGWPLRYLIGDLFKTMVIPVVFLVTTSLVKDRDGLWHRFLALYVPITACKIFILVILTGRLETEGTLFYILLITAVTRQFAIAFPTRRLRFLAYTVLVLSGADWILSARRAPTVAIAIVTGLALTIQRNRISRKVISTVTMCLVTIVILVSPQGQSVIRRLAATYQPANTLSIDISTYGRFSEVRHAWGELIQEGYITVISGKGQGAVYSNPEEVLFARSNYIDPGSVQVHNIHVGPMAILYRQGLIGLTLWISMCLCVLLPLRRSEERVGPGIVIRLAFLIEQLVFFTAYVFIGSPVWGVFMATVVRTKCVAVHHVCR
ncbi:MAG: hypothetical protein ACOX4K_05850 [Bacillota bacterium]|jgi:hypothetical protein